MNLPAPKLDGACSLEKAIALRRSVRAFAPEPLSLEDVSQLLWAAQGITGEDGLRSAPSAGATYPLQTYMVAGNVTGLDAGVYRYENQGHSLSLLFGGDERTKLCDAALGQSCVLQAPLSLILTAVKDRTIKIYKGFGEGYVNMEAGHAAQNVHLQAAALGLASVPVGAFDAAVVKRILWLMPHEETLYILPVGKPAQGE